MACSASDLVIRYRRIPFWPSANGADPMHRRPPSATSRLQIDPQEQSWTLMNISKFFIDRPIFAGVLSVLILLAGGLAVFQLPISEYPEVVPPSVVVRAQYPGANPKVIAETVAAPLEESINGVENMLYMQSQANSDGDRKSTRQNSSH